MEKDLRSDALPFGSSASKEPTEECSWCHWRYPSSQLGALNGRRLCAGCTALYHDDEETPDAG